MYLRADKISRLYSKEVETVADFFGAIGGILEVVMAVGLLCTAAFVKRSMHSEIVQNIYQV